MVANFDVPTAIPGILGGMQSALQGIEQANVRKEQQQAQLRDQEILSQGAQLLQTGKPIEISQWALQNPQYAQQFIQAVNLQDELSNRPRIEVAQDILSGRINPREAYTQRLEQIQSQGGNASELENALQTMTDEELFQLAEKDLSILAPKRFNSYWKAVGKDRGSMLDTANIRDFEKYKQLKSSDPEEAKMFAKKVGLIPKDRPLSSIAEKALIDAQESFNKSTSDAREYELLAADFDRFAGSLPAGTAATVSEFIKSVTGTTDEASELRRRFNKVRLSQALKYLPPGPATDRDVQEAFKGVPKETANPEQVKSFLRGAAKMALVDSEFQRFKAAYISEEDNTKDLIKAWEKAIEDGEIESINALEAAAEIESDPGISDSPTIGEVIDGWEYIGGDPANPNSWRQ